MALSDDDIERIARKLKEMDSCERDFWIESKEHYDDHIQIKSLLKIFDQTKSAVVKTVVKGIVIGLFLIAAFYYGLGGK